MEGTEINLNSDITPAFAWRDQGKPWKPQSG